LDLSDCLRNMCLIQGLISDWIQMIVQSRNYQNIDEMAKTALVEESAIASKQERYRTEGVSVHRCSNCRKTGHSSNKCYSQSRVEDRVNPIVASGSGVVSQVTCFRCGEKGHIARNCPKSPRKKEDGELGRQHTLANNTHVKSIIVQLYSNTLNAVLRGSADSNQLHHKAATVHTFLHTWLVQ
jgi:hypothetical protein